MKRTNPPDTIYTVADLTKREYFAALAMQGLLTADNFSHEKNLAPAAVVMAETLIKALNKEDTND